MQIAASHSFLHLGVLVILVLAVVTFLVINRMRSHERNRK